jgi:peptidoglycan/xylan/chitin deacetylase (PgdA/CDA1 family)
MNAKQTIATCPVMVGINVDIDAVDAANAGEAGVFGRYSYGRYGAREGIWHLLHALADNGAHATFFVIPEDLERHPRVLAAILDGGHELAVRGLVRERAGAPETLDRLAADRDALQRIAGVRPQGWRALNGIATAATLPALAAAGYAYDSSAQDDDNPYVMAAPGGAALVELPVFDYLTDSLFFAQRHSDARAAKAWREEADAQYCAGGYVNLTLHTRGDSGSGRPPRARRVGEFLRELGRRPGVAFYRADQLAAAWRAAHPATEPYPVMLAPEL